MSKQKQSRADLQGKKIEALTRIMQQVMKENEYLRSLETIKLMPGYEEAMNSLKEKIQKDVE
jgi:tripartite-type tricarboxylate transporter receptor subunit TctC